MNAESIHQTGCLLDISHNGPCVSADDMRTEIAQEVVESTLDEINRRMNEEFSGTFTTSSEHGPPLTLARLEKIHDYCSPEEVTLFGQTHLIYGFEVHQFGPPGETVTFLVKKRRPGDDAKIDPLRDVVMISEWEGKAWVPNSLTDFLPEDAGQTEFLADETVQEEER